MRYAMLMTTLVGLLVAWGCAETTEPPVEAAPAEAQQRGATGGKADHVLTGTCGGAVVDLCGGRSEGNCWCDADCARWGDCCSDAAPVCGVASNRLEDRTAGLRPRLAPGDLELVADLPYPPGNVAVSPSGRVFFSFHPEGNKGDIAVAELIDGRAVAYPDERFQAQANSILSLRVDRHGRLWTLDYGNAGLQRPRLTAVDLATDRVVIDYEFPRDSAPFGSTLNDFQVSPDGSTVFIADTSFLAQSQAIVVVELGGVEPVSYRRLEGHPSVGSGPYDVFVDGRLIRLRGLIRPSYGIDSIALDQSGEYLYYASLNSGLLFRVRSADLRRASRLTDAELDARVEHVADITISDGIASDAEGHIYITDPEHFAMLRVNARGRLELLLKDRRLRWPDGLSWGPDGYLYVTASALNESFPELILSGDDVARYTPYQIYRLRPQNACANGQLCTGVPGH